MRQDYATMTPGPLCAALSSNVRDRLEHRLVQSVLAAIAEAEPGEAHTTSLYWIV
jgi:hypothetical protein